MTVKEMIARLTGMDPDARVYAEIPTYQEDLDSYYLRHFVADLSEDGGKITLEIGGEPDPSNPDPDTFKREAPQ